MNPFKLPVYVIGYKPDSVSSAKHFESECLIIKCGCEQTIKDTIKHFLERNSNLAEGEYAFVIDICSADAHLTLHPIAGKPLQFNYSRLCNILQTKDEIDAEDRWLNTVLFEAKQDVLRRQRANTK